MVLTSSSLWAVASRVLRRFAWSFFRHQLPLLLIHTALLLEPQARGPVLSSLSSLSRIPCKGAGTAGLPAWRKGSRGEGRTPLLCDELQPELEPRPGPLAKTRREPSAAPSAAALFCSELRFASRGLEEHLCFGRAPENVPRPAHTHPGESRLLEESHLTAA